MKLTLGALLFIAGLGAGFFADSFIKTKATAINFQEKHSGNYTFINPLLECTIAEELLTEALRPFKAKLIEFTENLVKEKQLSIVSIYFRDLNNGPWIGINEKEEFSPASL